MSNLKRATPEERKHLLSHFEAAEYFSMLASAISGGVESPIQFVTQVNKITSPTNRRLVNGIFYQYCQ